jgi:hypothetical protein
VCVGGGTLAHAFHPPERGISSVALTQTSCVHSRALQERELMRGRGEGSVAQMSSEVLPDILDKLEGILASY